MESKPALFIDGHWKSASNGIVRPLVNPATEEKIADLPVATESDLAAAVSAAVTAFRKWRHTSAWERGSVLRKTADLLRARVDELAPLMSEEQGKPMAEAKGEFLAAADQFEWYAEETKRIYGQTIEARDSVTRMSVVYQPVGVVAAFAPWNFPALLPARKIAAALAAGCTVIVKPAEEAPRSCMALVQALSDAGLLPGAINMVLGDPGQISSYLIARPEVRKISLTGSVPVGKLLMQQAARGLKKVSLELGGHAPVIICADADVALAGRTCATAKFRNMGQVCISPSRFFVHESRIDEFTEHFVAVARNLKLGNGLEAGVDAGPLANKRRLEAAEEFIADAVKQGARVVYGGKRPSEFKRGFFFQPTVLRDVKPEARIMIEEPFAPVAPIVAFRTEDEALEMANNTPFGLAGYVYTSSLKLATRLPEALEVGMVGVNTCLLAAAEIPFGGVKESGMGREGGALGIKEYLEPKFIKMQI